MERRATRIDWWAGGTPRWGADGFCGRGVWRRRSGLFLAQAESAYHALAFTTLADLCTTLHRDVLSVADAGPAAAVDAP